MYYRLKEPWAFRGWSRLPFAICAEGGPDALKRPRFFGKELFQDLLQCNGAQQVDPSSCSEAFARALEEMVARGSLEASETPLPPLASWQRYRVYPSPYRESAHWAITGNCNFNCRHCLVSAPHHHQSQLPLQDCLHVVDEIARSGIKRVDLTGGEPFVRSDWREIVKALTERGITVGVIFTNASLLDDSVLDALTEYHQHPIIQISFDGKGHHDWLRGIPGAEERADAAFRLLSRRGFSVTTSMCIHQENRDSFEDTVDYLVSVGVGTLKVNAPQVLGIWQQTSQDYALTEEEVWETYRAYIPRYFAAGMPINLDLDGYFHCGRGETAYTVPYHHDTKADTDWSKVPYCETMRYNIHIRPDGRVAPCMGFSDTVHGDRFPSLLDTRLGDILTRSYYTEVADTRLSAVLAHNPQCRSCEHWLHCNAGCMVQDISADGDYLIPDQRICYFHKHIGAAAVREVADAAIAQRRA